MDGNPYTESEDRASEYLRLTVGLLSKHHIPLSPLNYRLGYDSVSGRITQLTDLLQEYASSTDTDLFDPLWELHQRLYTIDSETLEDIRVTLNGVIDGMQGNIKGSGESLTSYVTRLNRFSILLAGPSSAQTIMTEIQELKEHTLATEQAQRSLNTQLARVAAEMDSLRKELQQVRDESYRDFLTGIPNRKAFDAALENALHGARADKSIFSLLMADVDHFKHINDGHGHLIGDKVLRFVAATLRRSIKGTDIVARIGGEEFAVILPRTDMSGAYAVAEQIRRAVSHAKLKDIHSQTRIDQITISIGVAQFDPSDQKNDLLRRADQALYKAKERGRDRIEVAH